MRYKAITFKKDDKGTQTHSVDLGENDHKENKTSDKENETTTTQ